MATITAATNEKVYSISKWGGLNEHPDGDTRLKIGEASKMINWKVTRDGNLKRRPGTDIIMGLLNQYKEKYAEKSIKLTEYDSDKDEIAVYYEISTKQVPGVITPVSKAGSIELGIWKSRGTSVEDGIMYKDDEDLYNIEHGVLTINESGYIVHLTIAELIEDLEELSPGEYIYTSNGEAVYALKDGCVIEENKKYIVYGYLVTAVPDNDTDISPVMGMWSGYIGGKLMFLAACGGNIYSLYNDSENQFQKAYIGSMEMDNSVNFVPFGDNVYIQNGHEYYVFDGHGLNIVEGYRPLVATGIGPIDSGLGETTGEAVNRLNGKRRCWISGDGEHNSFQLPEGNLSSIDWVKDLLTGDTVYPGYYSYDLEQGIITFAQIPDDAENSYEIAYSVAENFRIQVTGNLFAELYSGQTDTMLCLYGDGTNRFIYSGMDYDGLPRADYFPDLAEGRVGDSNTPITAMIRHGSALIVYKPTEAWSLSYGQITLANGNITDAFYILPVNKNVGNAAPGQVRLVNNNPVTCSSTELYQWINSSYYSSNLTRDERQAKRISDRIQKSIKEIDMAKCLMWDDNDNQEFYLVYDGVALVWNYAQDVWYRYSGFRASRMCNFLGEVYIGTPEGTIVRLTDYANTDGGEIIESEWESGAMDFGASYIRKYSSMLWIGLKPQDGTSVEVCVETDRKNTFREKVISSTKAKVPGQPFMVRSKIKAKKFVYYRLLLSVKEIMPAVTVTNVDFRVRQTGYAK